MPCRKPRTTRGGRGRGRNERKAAEPEWTSSDSAAPTPPEKSAGLAGVPDAAAPPKELRPKKEGVTYVTDGGTASGDEPMPDAENSDEWEDIDAGL